MGIRETLNKNPAITTGVTIAVILALAIYIGWYLWSGEGGASGGPSKIYYSDDDGASWFADDVNKLPPYDHNGKQAVRARVFKCPGGKEFVAYLERYTEQAKAQMQKAQGGRGPAVIMEDLALTALEVKKPNSKDPWVKQMDSKGRAIMQVKCPNKDEVPEAVMP